ncbi:MAG: Cna B-type domain-containing protein [Faecousia sp.]
MKWIRRMTAALLCVMAVCLLLPWQALAAESIDLNRDVSLTISCQDGSTSLVGAEFDIFLVATADEYGELTTTKDFARFPVNISGENHEAYQALASTLEGYVLRDDISPTDSGETDHTGLVSFPNTGKRLKAGLYLVLGHRHTQNGYRYDPAPFMVMLPGSDSEDHILVYDAVVNAKFDASQIPDNPDDHTIDRKVLKVWADDGHENDRPEEVIVQLLRDGKVYDTVALNAAGNWRYTWTGLDDRYTWTVVEKESEGYTVEVTREGITFVVTNTCNEEIPDTPDPTTPTTPTKPTLPETGQLWWPVPVLMAAGMLFVVIGLVRRRGMIDDD